MALTRSRTLSNEYRNPYGNGFQNQLYWDARNSGLHTRDETGCAKALPLYFARALREIIRHDHKALIICRANTSYSLSLLLPLSTDHIFEYSWLAWTHATSYLLCRVLSVTTDPDWSWTDTSENWVYVVMRMLSPHSKAGVVGLCTRRIDSCVRQ